MIFLNELNEFNDGVFNRTLGYTNQNKLNMSYTRQV